MEFNSEISTSSADVRQLEGTKHIDIFKTELEYKGDVSKLASLEICGRLNKTTEAFNKRIAGVLLGSTKEGIYNVSNSIELLFKESSQQPDELCIDYFKEILKTIETDEKYKNETLIGIYTNLPKSKVDDLLNKKNLIQYFPNLILLFTDIKAADPWESLNYTASVIDKSEIERSFNECKNNPVTINSSTEEDKEAFKFVPADIDDMKIELENEEQWVKDGILEQFYQSLADIPASATDGDKMKIEDENIDQYIENTSTEISISSDSATNGNKVKIVENDTAKNIKKSKNKSSIEFYTSDLTKTRNINGALKFFKYKKVRGKQNRIKYVYLEICGIRKHKNILKIISEYVFEKRDCKGANINNLEKAQSLKNSKIQLWENIKKRLHIRGYEKEFNFLRKMINHFIENKESLRKVAEDKITCPLSDGKEKAVYKSWNKNCIKLHFEYAGVLVSYLLFAKLIFSDKKNYKNPSNIFNVECHRNVECERKWEAFEKILSEGIIENAGVSMINAKQDLKVILDDPSY